MAISGEKNYLEVLRELRALISQEYRDGDWLPSGRKMAERFGVSRTTYLKAIRCLEHDNILRPYPKKGHYVLPELLRAKKIGIVLNEAGDSPYMRKHIMESVLSTLSAAGYSSQLIQAPDCGTILDKALIHGVSGLIWLFPLESTFPYLQAIQRNSDLPLVAVSPDRTVAEKAETLPLVSEDSQKSAEAVADFFVGRKHAKVAYVAKAGETSASFDCFSRGLKRAGGEAILMVHGENGREPDLSQLADECAITGLVISGGAWQQLSVIRVLAQLPSLSLTDLYVHQTEELETIRSKYPAVKVTAVGNTDDSLLGMMAAQQMLDRLIDGKPIKPVNVDNFRIETVEP
jgi:DNA-binding transcriptional regulator YhcF (GntR family)